MGIVGGLVLAAIVLYFPAYLWFFPYLHDKALVNFSQPLVSIQFPAQTQEVDRVSVVGQQSGNGDNCDYFSGVMAQTSLSKEELEQYYRSKYSGESPVRFFWLDQDSNDIAIHTLKEWVEDKNKTNNADVVIYIFEGAMTSAIDYRCS